MNREIYRHIAKTYGRSPSYLFGLLAEFVRTILTRVVVVIVVAYLASNLASHHINQAKLAVLWYITATISALIMGTLGETIALNAENKIYVDLAIRYHAKLTGKDMAFYRDHQGGYLVSLYRQYLDGLLLLVRFIRKDALRTLISLLLPPVVLTIANWRVGIVAFAVVIIQFVYIIWSSSKVNPYRQATHEVYREATAEVADEITNIVAYKSSGAEASAQRNLAEIMNREGHVFWTRYKFTAYLDIPREVISILAIATAFYLAITTSGSGSQSIGIIVLTVTYMFQIYRSVGDLPATVQNYDDILTKIHPTLNYLGEDYETIKDPPHPEPLAVKQGAVTIENLTFSYQSHVHKNKKSINVFDNFSLLISGGEHVGIVGLSGAGKSTLANLIMRFDEVTDGSIKIDGIDIREVAQAELRTKIAYVPQEPLLFHRTIRENIAYFNDKASQKDIVRAAKVAHAHQFIMELPDGYESMVGDRGVKLSGGQKQRVAIARAILKDAPIMIFDEATSALDSESEKIIQQALPKIVGRQTAIVIAHRLSTIKNMDRIAVLEKGKITQLGSHDELMRDKNGLYARLWAHQSHHGILEPSLEE